MIDIKMGECLTEDSVGFEREWEFLVEVALVDIITICEHVVVGPCMTRSLSRDPF